MSEQSVVLCPGQGAQAVGMGRAWAEASPAARAIFDEADAVLGDRLGATLSSLCFDGPAERLDRTDASQPAIYTCSVACWAGLHDAAAGGAGLPDVVALAGLSLGEYTALHLGGAFDFATGLQLVARRGRLMQDAAEASVGGMVALIGGEEADADAVCAEARGDDILVPANYNAPGQIVLSGSAAACDRAVAAAEARSLRATRLTVAGAFHSPLMQPAADAMAEVLAANEIRTPTTPVWSNVTGEAHVDGNVELLRERLVQQITSPVRWSQGCLLLPAGESIGHHELAPGTVLRGLMRRIDRTRKVTNHDQPRTSTSD
jgi:[acyl-carrier-protein] S-malonyltransferase